MSTNHCWKTAAAYLFAATVLVGCERPQQLWLSPVSREIRELQAKTVPPDGSLLHGSNPARNQSGVRATWEIRTKSDSQSYFEWLSNQLGPQYRRTSWSTSAVSFVKDIEGDSYTISIRTVDGTQGTTLEAQFVAVPD